jgi:hypothetical protein
MAKVPRYPGYDLLEGMDGKRAANSGPEFEIDSPIKLGRAPFLRALHHRLRSKASQLRGRFQALS